MTSPTIDNAPVVIVGGFLTKNSTSYWGDLQQHFPGRKVIIAPVGACSSLHDRACEIYYSLKGGRVDYGAEHAREHKHGQYGRKYSKGFYPEWSPSKPVHFATHSLGGPTVTKLIALLRSGFFGQDAHPDMVRSLFAVAAPFKGTPTVYLLGASYTGSHLLRPFSLGNFLAKYIHISSFLSPLFSYDPEAWDFQPDSRNLGVFSLPHRCEEVEQEEQEEEEASTKPSWTWTGLVRSVRTLWTQLRTSDWADSADSGSYDATFHAADARDRAGESELNANTFYCSLMGTITTKEADSNHHRPDRSFRSDIFLYILAKMVGSFSYNVQPAPAFLFEAATPTTAAAGTPPTSKPVECSHPVARARGLSVHTANLSSSSSSISPASDSSALASATSSSGSSGWNSPHISPTTFSFSFPARPLSQLSDDLVEGEEEKEIEPVPVTAPLTRPKLSIKPLSITPPSGPVSSPTPTASRRRPGHSREVSLTDCYADWAAEWSTRQYPVPGGWESRDVATATPTPVTAVPPRTPFSSSIPEAVAPAPAATTTPKLRDDLWENDGVVAVYSQTHPADCSDAHCNHHGDLDLDEKARQIGSLTDGTWHVFQSRGMSHNCLVGGLARYESHRNAVWQKISQAMAELDSARAAC